MPKKVKTAAKGKGKASIEAPSKLPGNSALTLAEELVMSSTELDTITTDEPGMLLCGKPPKGEFFRVHPDVRVDVRLLKAKEGTRDDRYVVTKSMASKLDYVSPVTAFLCVTLDGVPFLWLVGTGDDTWSTSARRIVVRGMAEWVRLVSHRASGTYHVRVAGKEPTKPDFKGLDKKPVTELLLMAFDSDHIVSSMDHPMAKKVSSEG